VSSAAEITAARAIYDFIETAPERPTLRDQFAMAALTGLLASHLQQLTHTTAALNAWAIADAMMKERSRET
jgi:hypothetical protein